MTVEIRVWAPGSVTVELVTEGGRQVMGRDGDDVVARLPHGTDYGLSVDGSQEYPDPRSAWQPYGVHGRSRAFDTSAFQWTDSDWAGVNALGAPMYELHIGTFTTEGTLDAAIEKLPHLRELGIRMVELMPVAEFAGEHGWGYDGVGLYAVHHAYGGPEALQRFVNAAHEQGLGVVLDVVYNHLGPSGNYLRQFAPYFSSKHHTPWGEGFDFDGENKERVREYLIGNALRWFTDFRIDALRLDAVHAIEDDSPVHLLAEMSNRVAALDDPRPLALIAESDLNDVLMVTPIPEGLGMTAQWADDVHHALFAYFTGEHGSYYEDFADPGAMKKCLERVFFHDGSWSSFRERLWGRPVPDEMDRRRFVVYSENHDQIGNRAFGDRPESTLEPGSIAGMAALFILLPFTPMLFQGQEWAEITPFLYFSDLDSPFGENIAAGRRAEFAAFGWPKALTDQIPDPQAISTFEASKINWDALTSERGQAMFAWYKELFALRTEYFDDGDTHQEVVVTTTPESVTVTRGQLCIVVSPFDHSVDVDETGDVVMKWGDVRVADHTHLGPHSVVVLRRGN